MTTFRALLVTEAGSGNLVSFTDVPRKELPPGEVLIRVALSSLNYKDGLAVTGKFGVIRHYPMIPGIDLAGTVEESTSPEFKPGDQVVVTACRAGETRWGGYAELARLDASEIVPLPSGMTLAQSMAIGTAGFTAMQSLIALERQGLSPDSAGGRPVLVTGASGGVGSIAVALLAHLGYQVAASTGREENHDYLKGLGATEIVKREELAETSKRPLESERWAAAIDSVGGNTLAHVLRTLVAGGGVAACGLAGGSELHTTVFPFILRGVSLLGIDSPKSTKAQRREIWRRLASDLPLAKLDTITHIIDWGDLIAAGERILKGQIRGRTVIEIS